ncbi:carbohydrate ABC transporter permease [Facklamia miroungae]|uniref:Raffinose/stachyose/melibiose transport system permease protein n=1 Tax=Facklamia miroungae TaxID=120956 RepID=A0A1G7T930_9LACT|nr:carbohydrate ABC transporter permease [Facklamia miroungae]NKZ29719.1 carbohydrate ABC transporter permease [Facklamia miroungae]SDG31775.1 raffinose/stachyose/melibiose transport system permease protein [Facklamia miroungae]
MSMIKWKKVFLELFALLVFVLFVSPLLLIVINSAKSSREILMNPLSLPENWGQIWENFMTIWNNPSIDYPNSFLSSVIITVISLAMISLISSLAAWGLVRHKSKTSSLIFYLFVASMVIPFQVVMYPLITWFRILSMNVTEPLMNFSLLRSYPGIILAYIGFGMGMSVFMFHGFLKGVPLEIEEAAEIDGANKLQTFFYVVMPIMKPIYVTIIILNGIWIWNDFLLPMQLLGVGNEIQTLPIAISNFAGSYTKQWDMILSSSLMIMIPIIIVFLFAQKQILKGMVDGAIK